MMTRYGQDFKRTVDFAFGMGIIGTPPRRHSQQAWAI
jgi:hypothetical protein